VAKSSALLIALILGSGSLASAQPVLQPHAVYSIRSAGSHKVVDVEAESKEDGAAIQQWGWLGGENQKWRFIPLSGADAGFYRIVSVNSGKVLDVAAADLADGARVIQYPWHDADNEKWQVIDAGQGTVFLQVKHSGKVLDVEGATQDDGAKLQQWLRLGGPNQRWILRVEGGPMKAGLSSVAAMHQVKLPRGDIRSLMVLRAAGASAVPQTTGKVTVRQGELAAAKVAGEPVPVESDAPATPASTTRKQWALPYQILGVDEQGEEFDLSPMIEAEGFRPTGQAGRFAAKVFIGVKNRKNPHVQAPLNPAIGMTVVAPVETVVPQKVELIRTNDPVEVTLGAVNPASPVRVKVIPSFDPEGTAVDLVVSRGSLTLEASPRQIQGFGLETSKITVTSAGIPNPKGIGVTLSCDKGSLEAESLTLDDQGRTSTTLRSIGTGEARVAAVSAAADAENAGPLPVEFRPPWLFLASSLAGGVAGAVIRQGAKRKSERPRHPAADIALGVLTGLVIAVAYAIGINVLELHPAATAGEALVFVVSAFGGYWGFRPREEKQPKAPPATSQPGRSTSAS
jgi:hypothetical protein